MIEGLKAYAEEHAALALRQASSFNAQWYAVRIEARAVIVKAFGVSAISEALVVPTTTTRLVLDTVDKEPDKAAMDSDFEE